MTWLEQLLEDEYAATRGKIRTSCRGLIINYQKLTGKPYRVIWAICYSEFEEKYGIKLPHQKDKLEFITKKGKLEEFYEVVKEVCDERLWKIALKRIF